MAATSPPEAAPVAVPAADSALGVIAKQQTNSPVGE